VTDDIHRDGQIDRQRYGDFCRNSRNRFQRCRLIVRLLVPVSVISCLRFVNAQVTKPGEESTASSPRQCEENETQNNDEKHGDDSKQDVNKMKEAYPEEEDQLDMYYDIYDDKRLEKAEERRRKRQEEEKWKQQSVEDEEIQKLEQKQTGRRTVQRRQTKYNKQDMCKERQEKKQHKKMEDERRARKERKEDRKEQLHELK